jgi:phage terminase large subunit-like protein
LARPRQLRDVQYFDGTEPYCPLEWTPPLSPDAPSDGPKAVAIAREFYRTETGRKLELDVWQFKLICSILERYPDDYHDPSKAGELRFKQAIVSIPRQQGKSTIASVILLYSIVLTQAPNIGVLASTKEQANIVFARVAYNFDNNPVLKERFKKTQGRGIESRRKDKPAHFKIHAGRGDTLQGITFVGKVAVVVDELHVTKAEAYDAAVDGCSAQRDAMVLGISTAGSEVSVLLKRLYVTGKQAIAQSEDYNPRFGFWHWTVPEGTPLWDEDALRRANPAMSSGRMDLEQEILKGKAKPDGDYAHFRRYRRNEFVSSENVWIPVSLWSGLEQDRVDMSAYPVVLSVDRSERWERATLVMSARIDGKIHTKVIARLNDPGREWIEKIVQDVCSRYNVVDVVMDQRGLKEVVDHLKALGIPARTVSIAELARATHTANSLIVEKKIVHGGDRYLKEQLPKTVAVLNEAGLVISQRKSEGFIDAVKATVIGIWATENLEDNSNQLFFYKSAS